MEDSNQQTIDALIREFDTYTARIENDMNDRTNFEDLYGAILRSLPYLSDKREEKSWSRGHEIKGNLRESYRIHYSSFFGYQHLNLIDMRDVRINPIVRTYKVRAVFGVQLPIDTISQIDIRTISMTTLHQNQPF